MIRHVAADHRLVSDAKSGHCMPRMATIVQSVLGELRARAIRHDASQARQATAMSIQTAHPVKLSGRRGASYPTVLGIQDSFVL